MQDINKIIFDRINSLQAKNRWLDAFGRAGAEWVIIAMIGWYVSSSFIDRLPNMQRVLAPIVGFIIVWVLSWLISIVIGLVVKEPRPQVNEPSIKQLFTPFMNWKSFPSDHAMSAFLIFFMALIFGLSGAWALLVFALWVVWGRIYSGVHYPIDILGGIVVAGLTSVWAAIILLIF